MAEQQYPQRDTGQTSGSDRHIPPRESRELLTRMRSSFGGNSGTPDSSGVSPDIDIPSEIDPPRRFHITYAEGWRENLEKTLRDSDHFSMTTHMVEVVPLDGRETNQLNIQLVFSLTERHFQQGLGGIGIYIQLTNSENRLDSQSTTPAANRKYVIKRSTHFLHTSLTESGAWRQVGSEYGRKVYKAGESLIDVKCHADHMFLDIENIKIEQVPEILTTMKQIIERAGDFCIEVLGDKEERQLTLFPPSVKVNKGDQGPAKDELLKTLKDDSSERGERSYAAEQLFTNFDVTKFEQHLEGYHPDMMGGNQEVRTAIEMLVDLFSDREHFEQYGAKAPNGILLEGPPGTGKTLAARIIASMAQVPFYEFSVADLQSMWVGESPKIIKTIFANVKKPCVIFLDELDALAPARELLPTHGKETLQELLRGMDGLNSAKNVLILSATNQISSIDSALTRTGRFDQVIHFELPTEEDRKQILLIHYQASFVGVSMGITLYDADVTENSIQDLAKLCDGLSGSDIGEIFRRSNYNLAFRRKKDPNAPAISINDLAHIIEKISHEKLARKQKGNRGSIGFRID